MYELYFPNVKIISSTNNYYEAYKISYNLFFLTNSILPIDTYYRAIYIAWTGIANSKRHIYSMAYMPNLVDIEFKIKNSNWSNYNIVYYHKILPKVKSIKITYETDII